VVPNEGNRRFGRQGPRLFGAPQRIAVRHRLGHARAGAPAELGIERVRRPGGREQRHVRALRVDSLAVVGAYLVADAPTPERDRAPEAWRVDADARAGLERGLPGQGRRCRASRRRRRTGAGLLRLAGRRRRARHPARRPRRRRLLLLGLLLPNALTLLIARRG